MFLHDPATPQNFRAAAALPAGIVLAIRLSAILSGTVQDDYGTFILYSLGLAAIYSLAAITALYGFSDLMWSLGRRGRVALPVVWMALSLGLAFLAALHAMVPLLGTYIEVREPLPDALLWVFLLGLVLNVIALRLTLGSSTSALEPSNSSDPVYPILELRPQDSALLLAALDAHQDRLNRQYRKTRRRNADELPDLVIAIDRIDTIKTEIRKAELRDLAANPRRHSTPTS